MTEQNTKNTETASEELEHEDVEVKVTEIGEDKEQKSIETPSETMVSEDRPVPSTSVRPSVTSEDVQAYITQRLVDGASYRQLQTETGISKSTIQKYFPQNYIQKLRETLQAQETQRQQAGQQPPQQAEFLQASNRVVPSAHVIVPLEWLIEYEKTLPAAQRRIHEQMRNNIVRYNQQLEKDAKEYQGRPAYYGNPGYVASGQEHLKHAMAERIEAQTFKKMTEDNPQQQFGIREVIAVAKLLQPQASGNPLGSYLKGRDDQKSEPARMGSTNMMDLKLEEMRQGHDMDMQRITWEQKKFLLQQQADTSKWDKVTETFAPILQMATPEIRKAIRDVGLSVGKSINPHRQAEVQVTTEKFTCPQCGSPLDATIPPNAKGEIKVVCPKCGHVSKSVELQDESRTEFRPKSKSMYKES